MISPNNNMSHINQTRDRVAGILMGLAAGDKIGGPVQMALLLAESLHTNNTYDESDVAKRYFQWWKQEGFDTGPTAENVFTLVDSGKSWPNAVKRVHEKMSGYTAGCNPAHRSAPIAMLMSIQDAELANCALGEAKLTHYHPLAGEVSAAVVVLCRALIKGLDWSSALELAATDRLPEIQRVFKDHEADSILRNGYAPEVLRAALYFLDNSFCFSEALHRSVKFAGGNNYCPILVGSIGGARWGFHSITENEYQHHGTLLPKIKSLANKLAHDWK